MTAQAFMQMHCQIDAGFITHNLGFSWAKILRFRALFQCPGFLNIATVAFGVRDWCLSR